MRALKPLTLLLLLGAALVCASPAAARSHRPRHQARPVVLHLQWRLLLAGYFNLPIGPSYVEYPGSQGLELLSVRTLQSTPIVPPDCPSTRLATGPFGGPYLVVFCPNTKIDLYNLSGRNWKSVGAQQPYSGPPYSQPCREVGDPACDPAVGRYWMRFAAYDEPDCSAHCDPPVPYLQNIQTGQTKADPNHTGGRLYENLNSPSGASRLCSPLRYSDGIQVLGSFAITHTTRPILPPYPLPTEYNYRLRRCHSQLALRVPEGTLGSSQTVIWGNSRGLGGLVLPSLRRFDLPRAPGVVEAVEGRTVYVFRGGQNPQLLSATLPSRLPRR